MNKLLAFPVAASVALGGCNFSGLNPFGPPSAALPTVSVAPDFSNIATIIDKAALKAEKLCGVLPIASSIGPFVAQLIGAAFNATAIAVGVQAIVDRAAHAFCDALPPAAISPLSRRARANVAPDQLIDFGSVVVGGKVVQLQGYQR